MREKLMVIEVVNMMLTSSQYNDNEQERNNDIEYCMYLINKYSMNMHLMIHDISERYHFDQIKRELVTEF